MNRDFEEDNNTIEVSLSRLKKGLSVQKFKSVKIYKFEPRRKKFSGSTETKFSDSKKAEIRSVRSKLRKRHEIQAVKL